MFEQIIHQHVGVFPEPFLYPDGGVGSENDRGGGNVNATERRNHQRGRGTMYKNRSKG